MKKIFITILILFATTNCYANEEFNNDNLSEQEINLNTNLPAKTYKLSRPNYHNEIKTDSCDDDEMPINFMSTPLQILKQYQQNKD